MLQGTGCYAISPAVSTTRASGSDTTSRRGGRVVDCTALEMRRGGNSTGGSNPSLSATNSLIFLGLLRSLLGQVNLGRIAIYSAWRLRQPN